MQHAEEFSEGFTDHGVGAQIAGARGVVATADGDGRDVVLAWLSDCRGCFALLAIDVETGATESYPVPVPPGDSPFASVLSSGNRYYAHFNAHFVEFNPISRAFTFVRETTPRVGMGMTEDDRGRIWSVTYPDSGVVMYDPSDGEFRDFGSVYSQNWRQYQRTVAADDMGTVYFAIGNTLSQLIAFNPDTGDATPLLDESERVSGTNAYVYRDRDGKVYGLPDRNRDWNTPWYELYAGRARQIGAPAPQNAKRIVAGTQGLFHGECPSGKRIDQLDLVGRELTVTDPRTGDQTRVSFDYECEGFEFMGVAAAPDGTITGGASRAVSYDPQADRWTDRKGHGQWNALATQGGRFFVAGYTGGFLLEWDPARRWVDTQPDDPESNPRILTQCAPDINRPHALLAHPDGRTLIMAGSPGYGYTGGGLLIWDRLDETGTLLKHTELLPDHATLSLAALPDGNILVGSGTRAGTGGEVRATEAQLCILDLKRHEIIWQEPVLPGAQEYSELLMGPDGLVYGLADFQPWEPTRYEEAKRFFVFDPQRRIIIHDEDPFPEFGPVRLQQGQRKLVLSPAGRLYVLFIRGIACADPATHQLTWVARSPIPIGAGGDWFNEAIYFASGSHLWSYRVASGA